MNQATTTPKTLYWHGDLAVYTGKSMMLHGALFFEIKLLEGHLKGKTLVTMRSPVSPTRRLQTN